jgi:hyperosmotically inducible periplasmic protein
MNRRQHLFAALSLAIALIGSLALPGCGRAISDSVDDATITTRVKTSLLNDPAVGGLRIDVETFRGVVTLSGRVRSPDEESRAMAVARKVIGVAEVRSALQVEP